MPVRFQFFLPFDSVGLVMFQMKIPYPNFIRNSLRIVCVCSISLSLLALRPCHCIAGAMTSPTAILPTTQGNVSSSLTCRQSSSAVCAFSLLPLPWASSTVCSCSPILLQAPTRSFFSWLLERELLRLCLRPTFPCLCPPP